MNRATLAVAIALTAVALAGCSSSKTSTPAAAPPVASAQPAAPSPAAKAVDAAQAVSALTKTVTAAKTGTTITADTDPNSLLGRPGQYTSKVTFTDSRVKASDVDGLKPDDVQRGGAVEVFASASDAQTRASYIQTVTKSLPAAAEYDYVHGTVLVRVSHYLTPAQAGDYDKAAANLG